MQIEGRVVGLYFRVDAEGNPFHKALSRIEAEEEVISLTKWGLEGSKEWHRDDQVIERNVLTKDNRNPLDRALLCQSIENYNLLKERFPNQKETLQSPNFAENVLIEGLLGKDICIGDKFNVIRDNGNGHEEITAVLEVSNPRRPCYKIKMKHTDEVCMHTASNGLAGWFFRVIEEGTMKIGDRIVLRERIHPKWNLYRISNLMYCETNLSYEIPRWTGTDEEIEEILNLKELGIFRWKEVLMKFVEQREERELKWIEKEKRKEQKTSEIDESKNIIIDSSKQNTLPFSFSIPIVIGVFTLFISSFWFVFHRN